jgi:predicted nucleic acid-binding Zn ribbon protein
MGADAITCPECGKKVPNAEIILDEQRQRKKKKTAIVATVVVCLVVVVGVAVLSVVREKNKTGGSTYIEAIDMNVAAMVENDPKKFLNSYPEFMRDTLEDDFGYLADGDFEAYIEALSDEIVKVYGSDAAVSYDVLSKQHLEDEESQEYLEDLFQYIPDYSVEDYPVEDAYQLTVEFTFNGSVGTSTFNTSIAAMEFDGSWYILNIINPINTSVDDQQG